MEAIHTLVARLQAELLDKDRQLAEKDKELALLLEENQQLRHRLNQLLQNQFGAKSEKDKNPIGETFDEAIVPDNSEEMCASG